MVKLMSAWDHWQTYSGPFPDVCFFGGKADVDQRAAGGGLNQGTSGAWGGFGVAYPWMAAENSEDFKKN